METNVSILGDRRHKAVNPLMKKRRLITITTAAKTHCIRPIHNGRSANTAGNGKRHIVYPMEKYISAAKKTSDTNKRRKMRGVSVSVKDNERITKQFEERIPFTENSEIITKKAIEIFMKKYRAVP